MALALLFSLPAFCGDSIKRLDGTSIASSEIDSTVLRLMKAAEVPGLGLAVLNDGKIVYLKGYGFRDTEKKLPYTPETVVSGASFTKVVFAYTVLQLVDEGLLDLDKPIYLYLPKPLPEYENYADLAGDERYKKITAKMLLSHTSGFPNWRWFEDDHKLRIHFAPGSRYAYSGEGIDLLQLVVETITKQPLQELVQTRVFEPFGMTRSSMTWQENFESNFANGYDEYGRDLGAQHRKRAEAAGSLLTTVGDFARFMLAVANGEQLSRKTRERMLTPQIAIISRHQFPTFEDAPLEDDKANRLSYGLGWGLYWCPFGEAFFKEGHDEGWRNYTVIFDKSKSGMVLMTNSSNGEGIFKELLETVLKDTFTPIEWEGYTPYDKLPQRPALKQHHEVRVDSKVLEKYVGRYGDPPKLVLTLRREGDHLSIQENDEQKQELFGEAETQFFSKTSDDVFTFEVNKDGKVKQLVIRDGTREMAIPRIE